MDWWYAKDGERTGPITEEYLVELITNRRLPPDTLVWSETLTEWTPASQISTFALAETKHSAKPAAVAVVLVISCVVVTGALALFSLIDGRPSSMRFLQSLRESSTAGQIATCQNNLKQLCSCAQDVRGGTQR